MAPSASVGQPKSLAAPVTPPEAVKLVARYEPLPTAAEVANAMIDPEHRDAITTAIYCRWAEDEARKWHKGLITGERGEDGAPMIDTGSPDTEILSSDPEEGAG